MARSPRQLTCQPGLESCWEMLSAHDSSSAKSWVATYLARFALAGGYPPVSADGQLTDLPGQDLSPMGELPTP